jgi:hypothetical protein
MVFYCTFSQQNLVSVVKAENVGRAPILVLFPTLIGSIFIYAFTTRELERGCRIIFVFLIGVLSYIYIYIYIYIYMHAVLARRFENDVATIIFFHLLFFFPSILLCSIVFLL